MKKQYPAILLAAVLLLSGCAAQPQTAPETVPTTATTVTTAETTAAATTAATTVKTTKKTTNKTTKKTTKKTESAAEKARKTFRYDNFADGRLSDELLDSVNDGVLALLGECMYFEDGLQKGIEQGQSWVYSNSSKYVPQSVTFDEMVASGKRGGNCAMPQAWALMDMGVLKTGKHIYGDKNGGFANFNTLGKYVYAVATITAWGGEVRFRDLYDRDLVKPGDIFFAKGHTFIYLGDELFMAAGHDSLWHSESSAATEDSRHAVFDTWVMPMYECTDYNYKVTYQIRFRDDYTPQKYRNAAGELVDNPNYEEAYSIEYLEGYSAEEAEVEIGAL